MKEEQAYKLKKFIKELEKIRGRHTELVSVYIPSGFNLQETASMLREEYSLAQNVKDKTVRKNVMSALDKIIQHLKLFRVTPENGLVIFCGNVSPEPGKSDIKLWSIEPPEKLTAKIYRCDQTFVLNPLKELIREREVYGLIVLDAREANIGLLKGKAIESLKHLESTVPSKTVKGGMCVHKSSLILLENGTFVPIKKMKKDQMILCYDFKNSSFVKAFCNGIMKRRVKTALEIEVKDNKIVTSSEHLFFVKENGKIEERFAEDLKIGDSIFFVGNGRCEVQKIKNKTRTISNEEFYDISVPRYQNFIANGIIVHNSQARYDRLREDALHDFFKKVGESASQIFLQQPELKGIIIAGPGPNKDSFAKGEYLHYELKKKLLGVKDTSYTGEYGLQELVQRSRDLLEKASIVKEREILERFFSELKKDGKVVYGFEETKRALDLGAIDTLLISEGFDWVRARLKCQCGFSVEKDLPKEKVESQYCNNCKQLLEVEETKELIDVLTEEVKKLGTKVEFISTETREGSQFKELGGIGAFLRYKIS